MKIIAFANQKGGVGKTTTAVSLASCLAEKGLKILLIDFDPQSNATSAVGIGRQEGHSSYPALLGETTLKNEIRNTAIKNLDLIPSELDLAGAEVDIARSENYLHCLKNVLAVLLAETNYDFIFIDCPPSLGILTSNALMAAEGVIIPVQCEYLALEGLSMITDLIKRLSSAGNAALKLDGIVMTMFDSRTNLSGEVVEEVKKHFGELVYETVIPRNVRISEAPSYGQPITMYDGHSAGAVAYRALASEFLKRHHMPAHVSKSSKVKISGKLSSQERFRRCYFHEELDRPGVYVRTGFPADDDSYNEVKRYIQEHTDLKLGWDASSLEQKPALETSKEPYSPEFERKIVRLQTPKGPLRSTFLRSLTGQPGMEEEHFIKSRADAEKYLSLPQPEIAGEVSSFFEAEKKIGERGIVDVGVGFNPAGFVAELLGSEQFALMTISDREILHALCGRQMQIMLRLVKFLVEHKIGPFFSMLGEEYVVPPLHGPNDFNDFNVKYDKPIIDLLHEAGGRVHLHCHGRIKTVFKQFIDMGTDVLHPVEPPPMGDITAAEAKEMARGKMCLEGNIQIASMYEHTPEQIRAETAALIRDAFDDRKGLIVCPTASPYIRGDGEKCFEQFKAMIDTIVNF